MCFEDQMMGFTKMIHSSTKDYIVVDCAKGKHCSTTVVSIFLHSAS